MPQENETPAGKAGARGEMFDRTSPVNTSTLTSLLQFRTPREAALALLNGGYRLTRKSGQFLGQIAVEDSKLSEKQNSWLANLLARCGLPSIDEECAQ